MSDRELSEELSAAIAEIGRLKSEIEKSLTQIDNNDGGVAIQRLRALITPHPKVHVLSFPATAATIKTLCQKRKFDENDVLVGDHDQQRGHVAANDFYDLCEECAAKRVIP